MVKENPAQKFLRERKEKEEKNKKRERRRKARLKRPKDMGADFPSAPGVYKIINKRTGEVFVSYSKNMAWGIKSHDFKLRRGEHDNPDLQEDYDNGDRFNVVILKQYMDYDQREIMEDAKTFIESEDSYNAGYNRSKGGAFDSKAYNHPGYRLDGSRNRRKLDY